MPKFLRSIEHRDKMSLYKALLALCNTFYVY